MVDRMYKASLPRVRRILLSMRTEFSHLDTTTNWVQLRIDPLLRHAESLERILRSRKFTQESSRLRQGVALFHSDLVYLGTNVKALEKILEKEKARRARRKK